ncbi:Uu.00g142610.m01.CDS01 [Anthostomella pinea]|uniref:Uu.00g142610.m01.CDS01 n=1 Tax=Anthostomella pinea TaxID=933095 RepID=A0AAI8VK13_9PEZI|nr:Uu.00g142610.m01.CDS01 [Anthostomella pinea]
MAPGETYLIIDGLQHIANADRSGYLGFTQKVTTKAFKRFHLVVSTRNEAKLDRVLSDITGWTYITFNEVHTLGHMKQWASGYLASDHELGQISECMRDNIVDGFYTWRTAYFKLQTLRDLESIGWTHVFNKYNGAPQPAQLNDWVFGLQTPAPPPSPPPSPPSPGGGSGGDSSKKKRTYSQPEAGSKRPKFTYCLPGNMGV